MSGFLNSLRKAAIASSSVYLAQGIPEGLDMRFSIQPAPGDSGFSQWHSAMLMVAQLPGGIPPEFRRTLWLNLAERHLTSRKVDWNKVERECFSEWSHPADSELGVQIVKDLHRTGCSLFCGENGQENQALLKRVLLAYARWNKAVGYCQGFNMLAALILQVTERCESEALKLMIFLIEGVLPESYFADSLRGLSVDMAVFRELLKTKLPKLSRHLDTLQTAAKDGNTSYEPPLTNVFTMQWFLTLFCNCLPQPTVLRVWDLILLEGNEILLRTALSIWQAVADRILTVRSADEFYCIMGVLTKDILESDIVDANELIKSIVTIGALSELPQLREKYLYNINPWGSSISTSVVAEVRNRQLKATGREKLVLDIGALKKQYSKLKQRQRQAQIIFTAAVSKQPPPNVPVVAINHLLLGKRSLAPTKRVSAPKGVTQPAKSHHIPTTLLWKDAPHHQSSSSSSSDTELCDNSDNDDVSCNIQLQDDNLKSNSSRMDDICDDQHELPSEIVISESLLNLETIDTGQICEENVPDNNIISDIFDTNVIKSSSRNAFDFAKYTVNSDSDDETFDFEKFLESRVGCLKQTSLDDEGLTSGSEDSSEHRVAASSRKSSQRALDIIQENSLILHRILQCQNRITPPPIIQDAEGSSDNSVILTDNSPRFEEQSVLRPFETACVVEDAEILSELAEKDTYLDTKSSYNYKHLEKLEINRRYMPFTVIDHKDDHNKTEDIRPSFTGILDSEYTKSLEKRYENLIVKSARPTYLDVAARLERRSENAATSSVRSPCSESNNRKSPGDNLNCVRSPTSGKIYNPFPVSISSRQNKDLAIRLGLYKKS